MTTRHPRIETMVVMALMFVVGWPVSATAEEAGQGENRVRVAVMNFENNSSWHYWGDNLGAAAADELVTQLFKSGRFSLVERSQLEAVLAEQELGQSGLVTSSQAAEIGRLLGVQLILTGSITKFSIDTKGGGFGPIRAEYSEAETNLDIRLVNTNTAEIMFADAGEGKVRLGGFSVKGVNFRQDFDAGLAQEALRPAVEDVVKKIADQRRRVRVHSAPRSTGPDRWGQRSWRLLYRQGRELQCRGWSALRGPPRRRRDPRLQWHSPGHDHGHGRPPRGDSRPRSVVDLHGGRGRGR